MKPLIDMDILRYEIGFAAEYPKDEEIKTFDFCSNLLQQRIDEICRAVGTDEEPILYLTGKGNFREDIATVKPYKGNRVNQPKPFHFQNLTAYVQASYNTIVVDGIEADDKMAIDQSSVIRKVKSEELSPEELTVICTRDKDLRMVPGWHYGWECGLQPEFELTWVTHLGDLILSEDRKQVRGTGLKFFYSQLITGDRVDNIPGLPKGGPVLAYNTLSDLPTEEEMYRAVFALYEEKYGDEALERLTEQANLLWIIRETDEEGSPVFWNPPAQ